MGLLQPLLHRESAPRRRARAVACRHRRRTVACTACGWDMREAYHDDLSGADHEAVR